MKNLLYIGNKLSQKGKTVTTIDTLSNLLAQEGFSVKAVSSKKNKWLRLLHMLYSIIRYAKWIDYVLIDTYSTQNFYYAYLCSKCCKLFNLKYLPILHGGNLPNRLINNPKLSRTIFKKAYLNIAPSGYIAEAFKNQGYSNIKCIPNTIEIDNYPFQEREISKVKLLWVRSFSKLYNPKLAIDVLNHLQENNISSSLCMVGPDNDGSLLETKNYAKSLGLEVEFTGKLSKNEWVKRSKNHNIFINTTNFDNMPISVIEAMALGLPVISTNVGGLPYFLENNKNALLVEPNNYKLFIEAIINLKTYKSNRLAIVKEARNTAETYKWQSIKKLWKATLV
ncbi:glycosyltransferase family 4 protein [Lacinutrix sp. MedPE-SW]|uniref:glycosyltransferase family 4 protein n=1 Tax=Lacinutrix sp. MedPE-SW TaxID=1860087 RepID=UPI000923984C|nr:glycosyltransferase family 4 protein [Lacinutrix sp. MedPE-SW]OIQ22705.1 MAG: glycosyl transferase family 1 [Lacinutrix sp. MedPE-SW]